MICPKCGRDVTSQAQFCGWCGTQLQQANNQQYQQQYPQQQYPQQQYPQQQYTQQQYEQSYAQQTYAQQPEVQSTRRSRRTAGVPSVPAKKKANLKKWLSICSAVVAVAVITVVVVLLTGNNKNKSESDKSGNSSSSAVSTPAGSVSTKAGDTITFGHYEQDNNLENGAEPIEWIVLDVQDGKALLLSRYGLDAKAYNSDRGDITWEKCSLRSWLNGEFLKTAFSEKEQSTILLTDVDNSPSQGYSDWHGYGGNNTQDKVFILSYAEANKYLGATTDETPNVRTRVHPTAFAVQNGAIGDYDYMTADCESAESWHLRSPGIEQNHNIHVRRDGSLISAGGWFSDTCVRPVLWINLKTDTNTSNDPETSASGNKVPEPAKLSRSVSVGSIVGFGIYEQDNDLSNGSETIEWIVLDVQDGKALLLSRYGLDTKPFNTEKKDIYWENCTLRYWLDDSFLNIAFSPKEQSAILLTDVDNSYSQGYDWGDYSVTGGSNTQDKIFLLSYAEAYQYFRVKWGEPEAYNNLKSRVHPTAYAEHNGAHFSGDMTEDSQPSGYWWLRSPGPSQNVAVDIDTSGALTPHDMDDTSVCVRPAMWVNLESDF